MKRMLSTFSVAIFFLSSCTSMKPISQAEFKPTLASIDALNLRTTTKDDLTRLFGTPSEVFSLADLPNSTLTGEAWNYSDAVGVRLSFYFPEGSRSPESVSWQVIEGDAEQDLKTTLKRYKTAKWKVAPTIQENPHAVPDECQFEDRKMGISIEYRRTRKEVSSIDRWIPERRPASAPDTTTIHKYCIGDACSEGPAVNLGPLCKVPKL